MHKLNNIRRFLAIVASLAALLVVATILFRMHGGGGPEPAVLKLPVKVDVSLQRAHYTETKDGVKRWDLSAETAEYNKETDRTALTKVRLVVAGSSTAGEFLVTADRADYHNGTRDVLLTGNVHGSSASGMVFTTTKVTYLAARSQLVTGEPVHFIDGRLQLEGVGMEFQTQTKRLRLMKDVSAVYWPQGGR